MKLRKIHWPIAGALVLAVAALAFTVVGSAVVTDCRYEVICAD